MAFLRASLARRRRCSRCPGVVLLWRSYSCRLFGVSFRVVLSLVRFWRFIWAGFFLGLLPGFLGQGRSKECSQVRPSTRLRGDRPRSSGA